MSNKFNFTLSNKIYNCNVSDKEDIEIILPYKEPKKQQYKNDKEKISIISYSNKPITITMCINVTKEELRPKIIIKKSNPSINVKFKTQMSLISYGKSILTFSTIDNGATWSVYQQQYTNGKYESMSKIVSGSSQIQNKKSVKILNSYNNSKNEYIIVFDLNGEAQKYSAIKENSQEIILEDRKNIKKINNNFKIIKEGYVEKSKNTGESIKVFSNSIKMYTKDDTIIIAPTI